MRWDDLPEAVLVAPTPPAPKGYIRDVCHVSMSLGERTTMEAEWTGPTGTLRPGDLVDVDTGLWSGEARVTDIHVDYAEPGHPRTMLRLEDSSPF